MLRIKIVSCSDSMFWYKEYVGEEFGVIGEDPTEFVVKTPSGYLNIVRKIDAEVINE